MMSKRIDEGGVPGSKPRKFITNYRPNNPSLASNSMKYVFAQANNNQQSPAPSQKEKWHKRSKSVLELNPQLYQYQYNNNQEKVLGNVVPVHEQLPKPASKAKIENLVQKQENFYAKRKSSPKINPTFIPEQALQKAKVQFDKQRIKNNNISDYIRHRNSMNNLLSGKLGDSPKSKFIFKDFETVKRKQTHGYNIISCIPSAYE